MKTNYKKILRDKKTKANRIMNREQFKKCCLAIDTASVASAAAHAPTPVLADPMPMPIAVAQVTMITTLGKIFDKKITESAAKGIISAAAATFDDRTMVELIPIVGWPASAVAAAEVTEAIGWIAAVDFAKNS